MPAAPSFWHRPTLVSRLLVPFSWLYYLGFWLRHILIQPTKVSIPVICIGNVVAGGAGKTPTVIALVEALTTAGHTPHILSRGYRGALSNKGDVRVNAETHSAAEVGDEALMLSAHAPVWVGKNRVTSANAAIAEGATILVMDDGMQNPSLHKDIHILVIDGEYGMGNGQMLPAGPLREPVARALKRSDALVVMQPSFHPEFIARSGATHAEIPQQVRDDSIHTPRSMYHATLTPSAESQSFANQPVIAFSGIGRPEKFFTTLRNRGADIVEAIAFADHHVFSDTEMQELHDKAQAKSAQLITTRKDYVRLNAHWQAKVHVLDVALQLRDEGGNNISAATLLSALPNIAI